MPDTIEKNVGDSLMDEIGLSFVTRRIEMLKFIFWNSGMKKIIIIIKAQRERVSNEIVRNYDAEQIIWRKVKNELHKNCQKLN